MGPTGLIPAANWQFQTANLGADRNSWVLNKQLPRRKQSAMANSFSGLLLRPGTGLYCSAELRKFWQKRLAPLPTTCQNDSLAKKIIRPSGRRWWRSHRKRARKWGHGRKNRGGIILESARQLDAGAGIRFAPYPPRGHLLLGG